MKPRSRVVQCRLHPEIPSEAEALEELDRRIEQKQAPRQIIADGLRTLAGLPIYPPDGVTMVQAMLRDLQESLIDTVAVLLEEKIDELAALPPGDRRQRVRSELGQRSSFGKSILSTVDVADYAGDE